MKCFVTLDYFRKEVTIRKCARPCFICSNRPQSPSPSLYPCSLPSHPSAPVTTHCTPFWHHSTTPCKACLYPSNPPVSTRTILVIRSTCPNHFRTLWSIPYLIFTVSQTVRLTTSLLALPILGTQHMPCGHCITMMSSWCVFLPQTPSVRSIEHCLHIQTNTQNITQLIVYTEGLLSLTNSYFHIVLQIQWNNCSKTSKSLQLRGVHHLSQFPPEGLHFPSHHHNLALSHVNSDF